MKRRLAAFAVAGTLGLTASCQDFLDVNTNPNAPQVVAANLYLSPMLHWMVAGQHWDARVTAQYSQVLTATTRSTYDVHGPNIGITDPAGQQWRDVYWSFGQNLIDMMNIAQAEERWDILGLGYVLKAWGWQQLTSLHGEIIVKQAFDQTRFSFDYDTQEEAYTEVRRLLDSAIVYLSRNDGAVSASYMARGDKIYNGDRTKWLKFAHGLYAINLSHYNNRPALYKPADVIAHVDQAFASNADDALLSYPNTQNDDRNFLGPSRGNFTLYRQTEFVVGLMNGTMLGATDPRMTRMLAPAPDGQYRGLDPQLADDLTAFPVAQRPNNPYGYAASPAPNSPGIYVFGDQVKTPAMSYAQLQFIKAEAAYHLGNRPLALQAYRNGISAHIDFVNARNSDAAQLPTQITAAEKNAFLANTAVVPTDPNALTLTMIMSQKYIAQWAWAFNEIWMDLRRYHYTDLDPVTGQPIFPGFETPPTTILPSRNSGKPIYRILPRHNSEYVWNQAGLDAIGGLAEDYHTKMLWIVDPAQP